MNKEKKSVFRALTMITQLGLNVMVPIALCVFIGIKIDQHFNTYWVIPLMILGILAGGRNAYKLAMTFVGEDRPADGRSLKDDTDKDIDNE